MTPNDLLTLKDQIYPLYIMLQLCIPNFTLVYSAVIPYRVTVQFETDAPNDPKMTLEH